ncbi:MAG: hypothetical protein ISR65_19925 [Bacteriovoracaceae bacterium]|nr:hypothetical protein [Bacteriovoracaceae bacterium]
MKKINITGLILILVTFDNVWAIDTGGADAPERLMERPICMEYEQHVNVLQSPKKQTISLPRIEGGDGGQGGNGGKVSITLNSQETIQLRLAALNIPGRGGKKGKHGKGVAGTSLSSYRPAQKGKDGSSYDVSVVRR